MNQKRVSPGGLVAAVAVALLLASAKQFTAASQQPAPGEPAPSVSAPPATGRPAITPSANSLITDDQVRNYVLSHRVLLAHEASNISILSTRFMTSQQVRNLLHSARLTVPDQEPMCVVIMSGKFVFSGPPGQTPTFPIGVEVFDARTGNLVESGGLHRQP